MTDAMLDLGRRAVACKGWRWMPGMRATLSSGLVVRLGEHDEGSLWHAILAGGATCTVDMRHPSYTVAPDLNDVATLGCLLALVRKAWGDPRLVAIYCEPAHPGQSEGWAVQTADNRLPVAGGDYGGEAEALVAALGAAPVLGG